MTLTKTTWRGAVYHAPRVPIVPRIARTIKFNPAQDIGESHGRNKTLRLQNVWKNPRVLVPRTTAIGRWKVVRRCTTHHCVRLAREVPTKTRRRLNVWRVSKTKADRFGSCCWWW